MPAKPIKLLTNGTITLFSSDRVSLIQLPSGSDKISIVLTTGHTVELLTPSPADALVKLSQLETAMGPDLVIVDDQNTATTTTTVNPNPPTDPGSGSQG